MSSELHDQLSALGAKWLKRQGFSVIATEVNAIGCREQADVIGFRSGCSAIIESKISRGDFLADRKKPERKSGGLGVYRFYICPEGLITPADLPPKWGLLYAKKNRVIEVIRPKGNMWAPYWHSPPGWAEFQNKPDATAEQNVLFSIARRLTENQARKPDA